MSVFIVQKMSE